MIKLLKKILRIKLFSPLITYLKGLELEKNSLYRAGHYYSPIMSIDDIISNDEKIFGFIPATIDGINLDLDGQIKLLRSFEKYYDQLPFTEDKVSTLRYYYNNIFFRHTDAIMLYFFIRHFKPKRIIEIGSGYSSSVMLDANESSFLTFIDPNPERLYSLFSENDNSLCEVFPLKVQQIDLTKFATLEEGDILFIDSSHVSKTGSDVNYLLFNILPVLKRGVLIHFHDIFYPFEYPKKWVYEGRNWNEGYILRAFLMHNNQYTIRMFNHYLHLLHSDLFIKFPLCYKDPGGSIWIQKN